MEKRHFTKNQKKLIGGVAIVIFVVFSAAICWFVGKPMVKFVSEPEKFRMWVDSHGLWSQVAYVGMTLLQVLVAVIPGEPLEISGGYAFGAVQGTVLCMLGAFLGTEPSVQSAAACCAFVGIAGELASEKTDACGGGTMTFRNFFIDEVSLMTQEKMSRCKVHI